MPMLFALGQHQALVQTQARLRDNEKVMSFLDDIHIATPEPDRVIEAHTVVAEELWFHARIQVHYGKTQVWNRGGIEPAGLDELTKAARLVKPDAIVWKGDPQLPPLQQGLKGVGSSNWPARVHQGISPEEKVENKPPSLRGSRG